MVEIIYNPDAIPDLLDAVTWGDLARVILIITEEMSTQAFMNLASSLLHLSAKNRHPDVLEFLLANKAYVDSRDANMTTPLMVAANIGDDECVQLLLTYSADVNAVDYDDRTPLYFAAYDGHIECVKTILLQKNLDFTVVRKGGWTALHEAARFAHEEVVKALISHGMDIMATTEEAFWSPGHLAAASGRLACLELLIEAGIDVNAGGGPNKSSTLLHEACRKGKNECIRLLLDSGASLLLHDGVNLPHHLACQYRQPSTLDLLLTYSKEHNIANLVDAYTNADPETDNMNYNNALNMAAYCGNTSCLQVLLKHNAQNICSSMGRTPEILAVGKLQVDCLKLLIADLKKKTGVIAERREYLNPLYYLCRNSHKMLSQNISTNEKIIACACLLLNSGLVDINQYECNQSCLETAVQNGAIALVTYLLSCGADPSICHVPVGLTQNRYVEMCCNSVKDAKCEPKSLLLSSRIKIREYLLDSYGLDYVYKLPLPRMLKDYVYHGHYNVKGLCDI